MKGFLSPEIEQARLLFSTRAWAPALEAFLAAERAHILDADDLERLATVTYLLGRDHDYVETLERAHHAHLRAGQKLRGVRCAFWIGLQHLLSGESGRASGWITRAQRLAETEAACAELGYLQVFPAEQAVRRGDLQRAFSIAATIVDVAERFHDADLLALAQHVQGLVLLQRGEIDRGLAQLDEIMLAVTTSALSPILTGLMYCSVIGMCQQFCATSRAREWTLALATWCEQQPDMIAFTSACLAHRAEILRLHGAWDEALAQARRAAERGAKLGSSLSAATAFYETAEVHRLRGDFRAAEIGYRGASRYGREPQPGLALLRLAQGRPRIAAAAIRRIADTASESIERIDVLAAYVEIMLAVGDGAAAHAGCDALERIATRFDAELVAASAAQARGLVDLADGDAHAALNALRRAFGLWQALDAPYLAARVRTAISRACAALGDEDGATLELEAARAVFERLGALPDLAHADALAARFHSSRSAAHGLTRRELEVLQLVATGRTNRQVAAELELSEKTVDRHVSNIFAKLGVPSRAAATAYAYRYHLF